MKINKRSNKVNREARCVLAAGLFLMALGGIFAADRDSPATRRFGFFIGSNNGGRDRVMLRYAVSDARAVSRVFADMGGIAGEDNALLVEPSAADISGRLDGLSRELEAARKKRQRTELVFYYSGHADEDGLLLNRERYSYRELRERISRIQTDMQIVILDSCSSGAITRAKGGVKTIPFLFDSSVSAEGYAFLTSSSAEEASQESDSIESSYFTHSLVAGLRGAADSLGDGRVTLNELYRFAYTETLAKTETSVYGTQHPSYDIQISGTGDVVLTDIRETSAGLLIADDVNGRLSIRDASDLLIAELTKINQKPLELGLEPGLYRIILQRGDNFYRAELTLTENSRSSVGMKDFSPINPAPGGRNRGTGTLELVQGREAESAGEAGILNPETPGGGPDNNSGTVPLHIFNIQPVPGLDIFGRGNERAVNIFLVGGLGGHGHNVRGIEAASLWSVNTGHVQGLQTAGLFNITGDYIHGVQAAGIFNLSKVEVRGVQGAGIFNLNGGGADGVMAAGLFNLLGGNMSGIQAAGIFNQAGELRGIQAGLVNHSRAGRGIQAGLVNISDSETIFSLGLVNIVRGGLIHPAVFMDDMRFSNFSFRSGSRYFYSIFSTGVGGGLLAGRGGDKLLFNRGGFGFEYSIGKFFLNWDLMSGVILNIDALSRGEENNSNLVHQLRFTAGYKIFEHLGVFGGISYDYVNRYGGNSPDPAELSGFLGGGKVGRDIHKLGFFGGIQF
jgi:hypothetical protein